ncbi:MAG: DinB family protein [Gemmatimonadales bacterium]|nr:DinB family protein [Gemmatimonadales bacterium]
MTLPSEVWLRGPIDGIEPLLQPAAHALIQAVEDVIAVVKDLRAEQLWARPCGVAAIGFHIAHLSGSVDRLLTYSRGEGLSEAQFAVLSAERAVHENRPDLASLLENLTDTIDAALAYLRTVTRESLLTPREVGRKRLPSTILGLIFHAAEHSSRHAGQVVTLATVVK